MVEQYKWQLSGIGKTEKNKRQIEMLHKAKGLDKKAPQAPDFSITAQMIIAAFTIISQSRRYIGQYATPLRLTIQDINEYLRNFAAPCDYSIFVLCIYELDTLQLEQINKEMKQKLK